MYAFVCIILHLTLFCFIFLYLLLFCFWVFLFFVFVLFFLCPVKVLTDLKYPLIVPELVSGKMSLRLCVVNNMTYTRKKS